MHSCVPAEGTERFVDWHGRNVLEGVQNDLNQLVRCVKINDASDCSTCVMCFQRVTKKYETGATILRSENIALFQSADFDS